MKTPASQTAIAIATGLLAWAAGYYYFPALKSNTALGEQSIPAYTITAASTAQNVQSVGGKTLYANACLACHQPAGQGLGKIFPPLAETDWVTGDAQRLALIVLQGMTGPLTVNGQTYNSFMPGFKSQFTNEDMADVLNYIRTSWNNNAPPIPISVIQQSRDIVSDRIDPWRSEQELLEFLEALPAANRQASTP